MSTAFGPGKAIQPIAGPARRKLVSWWLFLLGMLFCAYLLGAAVIFFELPTAHSLTKAFVGGRAWVEREQVASPGANAAAPVVKGQIDQPDKTFDGFTLYSCAALGSMNTQVFLMDMRQQVVHRWSIPFSQIWPYPFHLQTHVRDDLVCIFGTYLYPNGDLLAVFHGLEQQTNGYGLVKLDKDSRVLWKYSAHVHHDVDVAEDGTIYAIEHELVDHLPKGLDYIPTPCLVDSVIQLSSEGKLLKKIPLLEAFRSSPYAALLHSLDRKGKNRPRSTTGPRGPRLDEVVLREDPLHLNFVEVLRHDLAPKFPQFKAGQILFSVRNLDTIGVLDPKDGAVVWAARGSWQAQHDPHFLANGRLLLFDNRGLSRGSRAIEYDPQTQAIPWSYPGEDQPAFYTSERGMSQRLPNGNTLIADSEGGRILEVTPDREVAWSCSVGSFVSMARRYGPDQVRFLPANQRARP